MFTKTGPNQVTSSEGFIIKIKDRFTLQYIEETGMIVEMYREPSEITGFCSSSIKNINEHKDLPNEYKEKIIQRISAAADFLGWKYEWY